MKRLIIITALAVSCMIAGAQEARYGVKSGKITTSMEMMGQAVIQEVYFDDYGAKQASISNFNGRKMRNINVDGRMIMVNDEEKTAVEMPMGGRMGGGPMGGGPRGGGRDEQIDWENLTEKVIRKNRIKENGEEEIAGKTCKVYTYTVMMMGQARKQTVWIYKGITMKTSMKTDFGEMGQTVVALEEDIEIDPAMFTVPEGVTIEKMEMPQRPRGMGMEMGGDDWGDF